MSNSKLDALVGQVLDDRYRLDKLLGAGGMGAVYKAWHTTLKREVAVKILHLDIGADPSISKRFDREAQSASRLDHPNCVRVTDFGTTAEGIKYLVMELLEGEELGARLGQAWAPDAALELLEQLFAGLEHAHACGIVHRDLKPENVFMTRDFRGRDVAKIVDFGIAKLLDADGAAEVLTRAGMVFGTPRYMSPEQAAGGKIDERSDLYSVGILAHELLSGQPPFDSDDLAAILRMQIMAPPPPLPSGVPGPVVGFVEALLEKSRHERPESAAAALARVRELRAMLREHGATLPTGEPADEAAEPGEPTARTAPTIDTLGATGMHEAVPEALADEATAPVSDPDAPLPSKPEAMIGHRVAGRFILEALLGIGGMGAVFRARDEQTGALVAVKLLHAALAGDEELAARFEREAETAGELEHPNIAPVFGHGTTPGAGGPAPYLVMPLLEGVELRELIGAPLEPARAVNLSMQLLSALDHAHGHGVVHRDLKPENVFVIAGDHVQLVDFGLAKVAEGGGAQALTQFGQVFGTPAYMSPEQCRGEVVDARTDLYAAGVILYELLAGRAPFESDDPLTLLRLQLEAPPPPLPEHVPPALRELVGALLVKDREQRIPDARAAAQALAQASSAAPAAPASLPAAGSSSGGTIPALAPVTPMQPAAARPTSAPTRALRFSRRWLFVGGAVVALLVIIAAWPAGDGDGDGDEGENDAVVGSTAPGEAGARKPDPEVYVQIDRELSARNSEAALVRIRTARDEFPRDGGLLWREARALALAGGDKRVTALHRYAEALTAEPSLAERTEFEAELRNLLRDPKLRETAIDVAVRELGDSGHSFLLEVINDEKAALSYVERHRILDELGRDPSLIPRVDLRRQLVLDLEQAGEAPAPCTAFSEALDRIAKADDPYYLEVLLSRSLEIPDSPGVGESAEDCADLDAKREQVKGTLAAAHPEQAAKLERANKKKKSGKKRGFRLPF